jgi:predicted phosphodiesterase
LNRYPERWYAAAEHWVVARVRRAFARARPVVRPAARVGRHPVARRGGRLAGVVAIALIGVVLGVLVGGRVTQDVGPFRAEFAVTPSLRGGTEVAIPPLGSLHLASHAGPAHLTVRLGALDQNRTQAIINEPNGVVRASESAATDLSTGIQRLALRVAGLAVLGAMLLGALVYRSMRRVAACGGIALAVVAGTAVVTVGTFRASAIQEPRYEGLLTNAPAVIGDARRIAGRYEEYQAELQRLITNVSRIYGVVSTLPVYEPDAGTIRVLHISDLHLSPTAWPVIQTIVQQWNIDLVIDTGDITDWGSEPEANYVASIAALKVPYVYIRGNHDSVLTAAAVARQPNATVLDNSLATVKGITIAGIGDPRFTPDKTADPGRDGPAADAVRKKVEDSGTALANTIGEQSGPVDVALVHDPASAGPLAGICPLVLAGHLHHREVYRIGTPSLAFTERTLVMVEGSTGGAGLRGLENTEPLPLAMSVLYFDTRHALAAYDDIQVGGAGQTGVTLERHVVKPDEKAPASPSPSAGSPSAGSPSPSST